VSELASFFYSKTPRKSLAAVAAHVATCRSCILEIAEYARAEGAAGGYEPGQSAGGEVPRATWDMIREWEESSFAGTKPPSGPLSAEMLARLSEAMGEKKQRGRAVARKSRGESTGETKKK
jgi:hypothetical protein